MASVETLDVGGDTMKVVYIAGPFRAKDGSHWKQERNIRHAEEVALMVWKRGEVALCPHLNTRNFQGEGDDRIWLEGDLELLKRCDAILMLNGWENSSGATHEYQVAMGLGLEVLFEDQYYQGVL